MPSLEAAASMGPLPSPVKAATGLNTLLLCHCRLNWGVPDPTPSLITSATGIRQRKQQSLKIDVFSVLFFLRFAAFAPTFARTCMAGFFSASTAALFAALVLLINSRPSATLRFFFGRSTLFVALFDMLSLSFLLRTVTGLISSWHNSFSSGCGDFGVNVYRAR